MFPKLSQPLAKGIRTTEGLLIFGSNVLLAVAAILPQGLTWQKSGLYITILNGVYAVSRGGVKAAALNAGIGVTRGPLTSQESFPSVASVFTEISNVEKALEKVQNQPGTPADKITQGLSPTPVAGPQS